MRRKNNCFETIPLSWSAMLCTCCFLVFLFFWGLGGISCRAMNIMTPKEKKLKMLNQVTPGEGITVLKSFHFHEVLCCVLVSCVCWSLFFYCLTTVSICYCCGNKEFDVNKDGVISAKEFRKAMEAQKVFTRCVASWGHARLLLPLSTCSPPKLCISSTCVTVTGQNSW